MVSFLGLLLEKLGCVRDIDEVLLLNTFFWLLHDIILSDYTTRLQRLLHCLLSTNSQYIWIWCIGILPHFCWLDRIFLTVLSFLSVNDFLGQSVLFEQLGYLDLVVESFDVVFRVAAIQELEMTLGRKRIGIIISLWSIELILNWTWICAHELIVILLFCRLSVLN